MSDKPLSPALRAAWLAAAAAAGLLLWARLAPDAGNAAWQVPPYAALGERLIHVAAPEARGVTLRLPAASTAAAVLRHHSGLSARGTAMLLTAALAAGTLLLSLQLQPMSSFAGPLALALLALFAPGDFRRNFYPELLYAAAVLVAAAALAWRQPKPSPKRTLVLALALGATLLIRSPLALLGPLLAALMARKRKWKDAAIMLFAPFLWLLPWLSLNYAAHGRFIPFENAAANLNLMAGAVGLRETVEGSWDSLGDEPSHPHASAERAALAQIARRPGRYALSVLDRIWFTFTLSPALFLLGGWYVWRARRRPGVPALALLCGYYVLVHCLLAVEKRYFAPLWPILAVLAASALRKHGEPDGRQRFQGQLALGAALGLLWGLAALAGAKSYALGRAAAAGPASDEGWARSLSAHPGDVELFAARARFRLREGDAPGAVEDFARCAALEPANPERAVDLAWARLLGGDPKPALALPETDATTFDARWLAVRRRVVQSRAHFASGRRARAARGLDEALRLCVDLTTLVREGETELGREALRRLRARPTQCLDRLRTMGSGGRDARWDDFLASKTRLP